MPKDTGVDDQVLTLSAPLTCSVASDDVMNRSPPVGSRWVIVAESSASVWFWDRNRVVPSGWSTGMMALL